MVSMNTDKPDRSTGVLRCSTQSLVLTAKVGKGCQHKDRKSVNSSEAYAPCFEGPFAKAIYSPSPDTKPLIRGLSIHLRGPSTSTNI